MPGRALLLSFFNLFSTTLRASVGLPDQGRRRMQTEVFLAFANSKSSLVLSSRLLTFSSHADVPLKLCSHRKITGPTRKSAKGGWTPEEVGRRRFFSSSSSMSTSTSASRRRRKTPICPLSFRALDRSESPLSTMMPSSVLC